VAISLAHIEGHISRVTVPAEKQIVDQPEQHSLGLVVVINRHEHRSFFRAHQPGNE